MKGSWQHGQVLWYKNPASCRSLKTCKKQHVYLTMQMILRIQLPFLGVPQNTPPVYKPEILRVETHKPTKYESARYSPKMQALKCRLEI